MVAWLELASALSQAPPPRVQGAGVPGRVLLGRDWDTGQRRLDELLCWGVVAGEVRWSCAGRSGRTGAGSVLLLPPGTTLRLSAAGVVVQGWRCRVALDGLPVPGEALLRTGDTEAMSLLGMLVDRADRPEQAELAGDLFRALIRTCASADPEGAGLSQAVLARCRAHLGRHRHRAIATAELARLAGLSAAWFARRFRQACGISPRAWLLQERVRLAAAALVEQNAPIASVARTHGWRDPNLFARQFRRQYGCTPQAFRRRAAGALGL